MASSEEADYDKRWVSAEQAAKRQPKPEPVIKLHVVVDGVIGREVHPGDIPIMIAEEIKASDDPFAAGGLWLTELTNAITEAMREADEK